MVGTMIAAARSQAALEAGEKGRMFDWDKAAKLIREAQPVTASAGLQDDWEWTGGIIWHGGKPNTEEYTYLASLWAIPELEMDGDVVECWKNVDEDNEWNSEEKWPESALAILNA
jgi:hypothetical protein